MPYTLVALDPGAHDAGIAFFVDGRLTECALLRPKPDTPFEIARVAGMWVRRALMNAGGNGRINSLICEGQFVYPGPRRNNPNDLFPLAQVVGGAMQTIDSFERRVISPREWTGSVPKEVRHRRFLATLDARETAIIMATKCPKTKLHNVIDACALGRWALGRLPVEPEGGFVQ
jgi:hypothetical protein